MQALAVGRKCSDTSHCCLLSSPNMQVKKDEADLAVGWGEGPKFNLPKRGPQLVAGKDGEKEVRGLRCSSSCACESSANSIAFPA